MITAIASLAGLLMLGLFGLVFVGVVAAAIYLSTRRAKALPASRWRNLQRDCDEKFAKRQLDEDYKTLIEQAGYDVE
jgi:hypothetical protein